MVRDYNTYDDHVVVYRCVVPGCNCTEQLDRDKLTLSDPNLGVSDINSLYLLADMVNTNGV